IAGKAANEAHGDVSAAIPAWEGLFLRSLLFSCHAIILHDPERDSPGIIKVRPHSSGRVSMRHAVVIDAVRTPIGRAHPEKGIYRDVRADDLSADLMRALLERVGLPASDIEDIQWGCVKQQGEQGYDVARMAALIAGLPIEVGGVTVNRNCGSSLQAINSAAASIAANAEDVQIAGGVEHMHHIPMEAGFDASPRLWYRHSPATMNMGITAENLAIRYK